VKNTSKFPLLGEGSGLDHFQLTFFGVYLKSCRRFNLSLAWGGSSQMAKEKQAFDDSDYQ
jgi:hypothetical protein